MEQRKSHKMCVHPRAPSSFQEIFSSSKGVEDSGFIFRDKDRRGSCSLPILLVVKGKGDRARLCTPCTGGQISGAAGSQAGLSRTDGADPGHRGGAHQSGGDRWEDVRATRSRGFY